MEAVLYLTRETKLPLAGSSRQNINSKVTYNFKTITAPCINHVRGERFLFPLLWKSMHRAYSVTI